MREVESEMASRDTKYKAKLNYLREEKLKADGERERMRSAMATLSKTVADNAAQIAETRVCTQGGGIPVKPRGGGSVAYDGWDGIESCPPEKPQRPGGASDTLQINTNQSGNQQRQGSSYVAPRHEPARGHVESRSSQVEYGSGGSSRVSVHREAEPVTRSNESVAKSNPPDVMSNTQGRGNTSKPTSANSNRVTSNYTSNARPAAPLPQRAPLNKSRNTASTGVNGPRLQNTSKEPSTRKISNLQSIAYVSWADEPVSDAEMIVMAEATTPGAPTSNSAMTPSHQSGNLSRSDILREAIVGSQLKEMRNKQQAAASNTNRAPNANQGKRAHETSSGGESSGSKGGSYADVASADAGSAPWQNPKSKKKKKSKVEEPMMDLLGVKDSPIKELFVMSLDFSRCNRTEQLENMVKHYCKKRGVQILYAKAFKTRSDPNKANCKIAVNEVDVSTLFANDFWPEYVFARYWHNNNLTLQQNVNESSSEDGSLSD